MLQSAEIFTFFSGAVSVPRYARVKVMVKTLYRLKPRNKILSDFYVFDVETGIKHGDGSINWHLNARPESFQFGVIYGRDYSRVIHSLDEFKEALKESRFKGKYLFAHNATYDLTTLYGNIFDLDPDALFIGSRFISCSNGVAKFADSLNIIKSSVAKIGKMLGIEKPALGDELFSKDGITAAEINRCYTDCLIVWRALFDIFQFAGNIKVTQASLSMNYFRANHLPHNIDHNELTRNFWNSYTGGRTEAFKLGPTHAMVIDVNSMYPYVMRETLFPNPRTLREARPSIEQSVKYIRTFEGLLYGTIVHRQNWVGYLPYKQGGKLMFPVGRLSGCWNFNELRNAIDAGMIKIVAVDRIVYADPMSSPFEGFVNTLYEMRLNSVDEIEVYRIKIFLNSLYGKFAQRIETKTKYIKNLAYAIDEVNEYQRNGRLVSIDFFNLDRNDCFITIKNLKAIEPSYAIPSFASYITSAARVKLVNQLEAMKHNRPIYCDTDSIFFEFDNGFKSSHELGGWKLENKIITEIRGLKNYSEIKPGGEILDRIKGVPHRAKIIAPNTFEYWNLLQTKEALRRNLVPGVNTRREKFISNVYDKREVMANGETKPFIIT